MKIFKMDRDIIMFVDFFRRLSWKERELFRRNRSQFTFVLKRFEGFGVCMMMGFSILYLFYQQIHLPLSALPINLFVVFCILVLGLFFLYFMNGFVRLPYFLFYIVLFLIIFHHPGHPGFANEPLEKQLILYAVFTLIQAIRPGKFSGLPLILFLSFHFFLLIEDPRSIHPFVINLLIWVSVTTLLLEFVIYYITISYMFLKEKQIQEISELTLADKVHNNFFPDFRENDHLRFFSYRLPQNINSGDFFDFIFLREINIGFFFADVAGHGISSSMMSAALKIMLMKMPYLHRTNPQLLLTALDTMIYEYYQSHHITAVYLFFDIVNETTIIANGGHPPVFFSRAGGSFVEIETTGSLIGYKIKDPIAGEIRIPLEPGDRFFVYTDGLTDYKTSSEHVNQDDFLLPIVNERRDLNGDELIDAVIEAVRTREDFSEFRDDVMIALLEIK